MCWPGKEDYEITDGQILYNGEDLTEMGPDERAVAGLFLAFQYPVEIPGVATMTFLRTAINAQRKARGEAELSTPDFIRKVREVADRLNFSQDMLKRPVNTGFSGGEKKRSESSRWRFWSRSCASSTRRIRGWTSTP
jgi:Fe-S cluster assembly ATP-binding protein